MPSDPRTKPLLRWNRIARQNTENSLVASMFEAALRSTVPTDSFTTWLLAGTAALAAFYITNSDKILPILQRTGFRVCGLFLCASCTCGLISKILGLICKIQIDVNEAAKSSTAMHLSRHDEEEAKIKKGADFWGIRLRTHVRKERILNEFLIPIPEFFKSRVLKRIQQNGRKPNHHYHAMIKKLLWQSTFTFAQSILFLAFIITGVFYAAAT